MLSNSYQLTFFAFRYLTIRMRGLWQGRNMSGGSIKMLKKDERCLGRGRNFSKSFVNVHHYRSSRLKKRR
jgi:hypothetical protein